MAARIPIYIGASHYVHYYAARDSDDGTYLNTGTCTYTLTDSAGTTVDTGTLSYLTTTSGNYRGIIARSVTSTLTLGADYTLTIVFNQGSYDDEEYLELRASERKGSSS